MKKVILSVVVFAFALSLGVGSSVLFPGKAAAESCIDVEGTILVNTHTSCDYSNSVVGVLYYEYEGLTDVTETPCWLVDSVCCKLPPVLPDPNHPGND